MIGRLKIVALVVIAALALQPDADLRAQETTASVGPVTGLKLPRFVSVKKRARARRGPSTKHLIDWVFVHANMPVEVVQEYGHWRRVRDREGFGGWVHYALLSNTRFVVFSRDMHEIRYRPSPAGKVMARAALGVIARLERCEPYWCRVEAGDHTGWTHKSGLWGVGAAETIE